MKLEYEVEQRLRQLARDGYPLKPWSVETAEDYGLFLADPQPTDEEIEHILADVQGSK